MHTCLKCGKEIGMFSPAPLDLENGEFLCDGCSESIKRDITMLYRVKTVEEFEETKSEILKKCEELYNEDIKGKIENLILQIRNKNNYLPKTENLTTTNVQYSKINTSTNNVQYETTTSNDGGMFGNIGGKIKTLAKVLTWLGIISFVIWGFVCISDEEKVLGLILMIGGSLSSWISSFLLYGFGQLIENSDKIVELLNKNK